MKRIFPLVLVVGCIAQTVTSGPATSPDPQPVLPQSQAYKGHEQGDSCNAVVRVYPATAGTRLDNCVLCHTAGVPTESGPALRLNACDYCHYLHEENRPLNESLNSYGKTYVSAGGVQQAIHDIAPLDSDGDGYSNDAEVKQGHFPGDAASYPANPPCPYRTLSLDRIRAMPAHTQFLLVNPTRQRYAYYASYTGVRLSDLLASAGVNLEGATGITVFAPDGYAKTFSLEQATKEYPQGIFYAGLDDKTLGDENGFVKYPDALPHAGLRDGDPIPAEQFMLLGYDRDGAPLDASRRDPDTQRLRGEGPLRLVRPLDFSPMPDRGALHSEGHEDYCYDPVNRDHNAGDMVRAVVGIRVEPMPEGYEEFDMIGNGWACLKERRLIVYGHGVQPSASLEAPDTESAAAKHGPSPSP